MPREIFSEELRKECLEFEMRYILCKEFGWDYYTYDVQPKAWIISIVNYLKAKNEIDKTKPNG